MKRALPFLILSTVLLLCQPAHAGNVAIILTGGSPTPELDPAMMAGVIGGIGAIYAIIRISKTRKQISK